MCFSRLSSQFHSTKAQQPPPCPPRLRLTPQVQTSVIILSQSHQSSSLTRLNEKTLRMGRRTRKRRERRRRRRRSSRTPRGRHMPWTTYSAIRPSLSFPWSSSSRPLWSFKSTRAWTETGWRGRRSSCSTASGTTWSAPRWRATTTRTTTRSGRSTSATFPPVTRSTPRALTWRLTKGDLK